MRASKTMPADIEESPARRWWKWKGTSSTVAPARCAASVV